MNCFLYKMKNVHHQHSESKVIIFILHVLSSQQYKALQWADIKTDKQRILLFENVKQITSRMYRFKKNIVLN